MAAADRHLAHADRIVTLLQGITWPDGVKSDEIRRNDDFLTGGQPSRGIHVVTMEEEYGVGVAAKTDVRYVCMVVRVMPQNHPREGLNYRSRFRVLVRQTFHETRIMTDTPVCEIITKTKPSTFRFPREWKKGLDITAMRIGTLIRETA